MVTLESTVMPRALLRLQDPRFSGLAPVAPSSLLDKAGQIQSRKEGSIIASTRKFFERIQNI